MADVAAQLGVSKMTVSRALNRNGAAPRPASEALRQQVLRTCEHMGYVVDLTAKTLSTQRSGIVAAIIPALNNSNFSDTAHGLTQALLPHGLQVLLGYTDYDSSTEETLLRAMLPRRPEGVILTGGDHTDGVRKLLRAAHIPVVETWDLLDQPIQHNVGFSNAQAVGDLVRALHARGYVRIGFLGGDPASDARGADRRRGFTQAMQALQLDPSRAVSVGPAPVSMQRGAQGIVDLMARWPDLQAVVCVSDHAAFGALAECHRRGWAVPDRVAIAGFGGFEVSTACHPQLSTVEVDCYALGRAAGAMLVDAIQARRSHATHAAQRTTVGYTVKLRGST
jgi:LacI family transcriptional regulator, gluconate utilization system Gnt-I transcriptional repressor